MSEMVYMSERITNMAECEERILSARILAKALLEELEAGSPSMQKIKGLSADIFGELSAVKDFEFRVERRKTSG